MFIYLFLSLLILPLFNAEQHQTKLENNNEWFLQRSGAANYLSGLPIRRFQQQLVHPTVDSSSFLSASDSDDQQQQRGKRIYWENLAFQPADYNHKSKNPKRSK
ncbi:unnamed protein product [Adineta steineri]|uniref:Uncharacterized protein n=1 Tax=Adineta steineri TaxID=433720 RepID=A0A813Y2T6_9BILA|nr:unnamed protein product [Adineta steineri]CAF0874474.1 unnamed protein product [Adineta steineri]CAF0888249.1 unnamed protein product [Adineta steineri]CAF0975070.1 unnamed protein product [Adineta steineri]CAF1020333.1 unnamed protein product [Adineta steineri]